jgi:Flagellar hook-length control protein FliK
MPVSLQAQILALRTAVEAALTETSGESRAPEVPWTSGQRLTAQVEAELPGGRYQIRVGPFQFDVDLPVKAQVGDALRLEFVSASPRVAFVLTPDAGQEPATDGTAAARAPQVQISTAGRVLTEALQAGSAASRPPTASAPVQDPVPLLPAPPGEAAQLTAALRGALDRSGLFYESHLVQWLAGDRPLAALLREPQGKLSAVAQPAPSGPEDPEPAPPRAAATSMPGPSVARPPAEESRGAAQSLDPQVLGQIRSQLDVIEQRQILWQGQAWPGQSLEWRIEEQPERGASPDEPTPWTTHLRLRLPRLGEVNAELGLSTGHVRVRLATQTGATAGALREAQGRLTEALSQAGLVLAGFAVTTDDTV